MKSDLLVWKEFLHNSTGVETKGCGAFYAGKWAHEENFSK
jgi:hypothetical protein